MSWGQQWPTRTHTHTHPPSLADFSWRHFAWATATCMSRQNRAPFPMDREDILFLCPLYDFINGVPVSARHALCGCSRAGWQVHHPSLSAALRRARSPRSGCGAASRWMRPGHSPQVTKWSCPMDSESAISCCSSRVSRKRSNVGGTAPPPVAPRRDRVRRLHLLPATAHRLHHRGGVAGGFGC